MLIRTLQEQLPDDAVFLCNLRFSDRGEDREADLIVAWPGVGVAVVEVKGGSTCAVGPEARAGWPLDARRTPDTPGPLRSSVTAIVGRIRSRDLAHSPLISRLVH